MPRKKKSEPLTDREMNLYKKLSEAYLNIANLQKTLLNVNPIPKQGVSTLEVKLCDKCANCRFQHRCPFVFPASSLVAQKEVHFCPKDADCSEFYLFVTNERIRKLSHVYCN
ncbi:hypothetical protein A8C56_02935 [Niabella ginsenosidivorans]|uniref:Uncharacterized protein n=1 Tax=Niabella ginsenosidivorans TaxID=1176587 RepID=A0A1A9HXG3_9BACT|nr:hypothetical protein [Niabella ginsenosidivorans]ANH80076.1 hypothetical protein A8C56_02935 [Niabella ginsenosidivorans]